MDIVEHALRKVVDYQDPQYGNEYLARLGPVIAADRKGGGSQKGWELTRETARHLALWMTFEDVFRVADLKTRRMRFERIREEVRAAPQQIVNISEFMHPRVEELCDAMPATVGQFILRSPRLRGLLARIFSRGRRITTSNLSGFLTLYALARLGRFRRASLRFKNESANIDAWLAKVITASASSYGVAVELAVCQRLVKGYGSTHERGTRNFNAIMGAYEKVSSDADAARKIKQLCAAALSDEEGFALQREMAAMGLA
jgi:indolepyruvate ferredoxin oxidoreductase beta subunit